MKIGALFFIQKHYLIVGRFKVILRHLAALADTSKSGKLDVNMDGQPLVGF